MKVIVLLFLCKLALLASIRDDLSTYQGLHAYKKGAYEEASAYFSKVKHPSDTLLYDMGNSLYRQKKYEEAITLYSRIHDKALDFKKYHNLGNCYAMLKDCHSAVQYYKRALRYDNNPKTQFNLALCQKILEEDEQQKVKGCGTGSGDNRAGKKNAPKGIEQFSGGKKDAGDGGSGETQKLLSRTNQPHPDAKKVKQRPQKSEDEKPPFNHYQEQKWDRKIKDGTVDTLLIPFDKGETPDDAKQPW